VAGSARSVSVGPSSTAGGVHDRESIGEARDHAQVVGDDQDRHPELGAEAAQQLQDLGLT
jgi:hypothetical protein